MCRDPSKRKPNSPAWRAGLRAGDRVDPERTRCTEVRNEFCAATLALWGGVNYLLPGREVTLALRADEERPAPNRAPSRPSPRPSNWLLRIILLLQQAAGVAVVLGAAWLVWIRPAPMTWGFFAYVIFFNPGQAFVFYAWLQQWPAALLVQHVASCFLQAAGYTGLLLFALRVSSDTQIYELRRHPALRGVAQRSGRGARADRQESERAPRGRGPLGAEGMGQPLRASSRSRSR